jgi:integrase
MSSNCANQQQNQTIILGGKTIEVLRVHLRVQEKVRIEVSHCRQENDLIFPSTTGTPMDHRNMYRDFKKFLQEASLPDLRFHDLRYTAASLMLNHGIPSIIVFRRLGHSKVSAILDIYGHLIPEMQQEAADLMDELISTIPVELHTNCTRQDE